MSDEPNLNDYFPPRPSPGKAPPAEPLGIVMTGILLLGAYLSGVFVQSIPMEWINDLLSFAMAALLFLIFNHLLPMALMEKPKRSLTLIFSGISFIYLVLFFVS